MKKFASVFLSLLAAPLILAQACTAQMSIVMPSTSRTCTILFKSGNITTEGCDFSQPLKTPKISPIGTDQVKIEFDQPVLYGTSTGQFLNINPNR